MNIVKAGDTLRIYGSAIETFKAIPLGTYTVEFDKMVGFYLSEHNNLSAKEKMYGKMNTKIDKIFHSYALLDRSFGIILSGKKGCGKSMFARAISEVGIASYNLPTILVEHYIPGIASFLESIEQEVIVIFDEFEKIFQKQDDFNPQHELLSLFDGTNSGKKMFIITCNHTRDLNEFLINRPGRFHYHFQMGYVELDALKEYLNDNLKEEYKTAIPKILDLAGITGLTYDYLRAIVFDLNQGYALRDTLEYLNIEIDTTGLFQCTVNLDNGLILSSTQASRLALGSDEDESMFLSPVNKNEFSHKISMRIWFNTSNVEIKKGKYFINPKNIPRFEFESDNWEDNKELDEYINKLNTNLKISSVTFERVKDVFFCTSQYLDL